MMTHSVPKLPDDKRKIEVDGITLTVLKVHLRKAEDLMEHIKNLHDSVLFFDAVNQLVKQGVDRGTAIFLCKFVRNGLLQKRGETP
jgi:hypothetical protein